MRQVVVRGGRPRPISSPWMVGGYRYTLVETVDHSVPYTDLKDTFGPEVLNVADLQQGFSYGRGWT